MAAAFGGDSRDILGQIHFRPQHEWVCDAGGTLLLDFTGRFERLTEDFNAVRKMFGLPCDALSASQSHPRRPDFRTYYDEATRRLIAGAYARDFQLFDYEA